MLFQARMMYFSSIMKSSDNVSKLYLAFIGYLPMHAYLDYPITYLSKVVIPGVITF